MTESTLPANAARREAFQSWSLILLGAAMVLAAMLATYATVDFTLGLVFAAPVFAMVVAIALAGVPRRIRDDLFACAVISLCATTPVLLASIAAGALRARWVQELAMTFTLSCAVVGVIRLLMRLRLHAVFAQAALLLIALVLLASPVWSATLLTHGLLARIGPPIFDLHPLIALNGAYPELGDWTHMPLAYQYLMNLGQDVPYVPPANVWTSAGVHAAIAVIGFAGSIGRRKPALSLIG